MIVVTLRRNFPDVPDTAYASLTTEDLPGTFNELSVLALSRLRNVTPGMTPYNAYEVAPGPAFNQLPQGTWPRDTQ